MKKLKIWLIQNDKTINELAKHLNISPLTLINNLKGLKGMRLSIAIEIEDYTNGEVTARDLYVPRRIRGKRNV